MPKLLTEKEAATKWCPFTRVTYIAEGMPLAGNRTFQLPDKGDDPESYTNCYNSGCAMWQKCGENDERKPVGYCGLIKTKWVEA